MVKICKNIYISSFCFVVLQDWHKKHKNGNGTIELARLRVGWFVSSRVFLGFIINTKIGEKSVKIGKKPESQNQKFFNPYRRKA